MDWMELIGVVAKYSSFFLGVAFPPLITFLNGRITDSRWKFMVALGVSLFGSVLLHIADVVQIGNWNSPESVLGFMGILFTESQIVYRLYFKDSKIESRIEKTIAITQ